VYVLQKLGYMVEAAESGAAGLAILQQQPVDLVLADLTMPGLSGWDVARLTKAMHPHLPVVLVTGWTHTMSPDQPERQVVDAILAKPFGMAAIQAVIGPLTRDLADAACSERPDRVGLTKAQGRPTHPTLPGTLQRAPIALE
jgi:CheY-like chemotaxis protein